MADPIMRGGSGVSVSRDANRIPVTFGVSTVDGVTPVPLEINPSGQLQTSSSGGSGTTQYTNGQTVASGSAIGGLALGYDGTNLRAMKTDSSGDGFTIVTDGTNAANVLVGDTGFNGLVTVQGAKTFTFTSTGSGAQTIGPFNVEGYSWVEIVYSSVGVGLTLTGGQFSPTIAGAYLTFTTWANTNGGTNASNAALTAATSAPSYGPVKGNFFQIAVSALTSGTFSGTITLRATAPPIALPVNAAQNGTWAVGSSSATGSGVPANAFYMGMINTSSVLMGLHTFGFGDATSRENVLGVGGYVDNGSTADRIKAAGTAANTTGTGLMGVGNLAFDGTNYQLLQVDTAKNLKVSQSSTTATLTNVASSASSVNLLVSNAQAKSRIVYNDSSAILYVKYGATASTSSFTALVPANTLFEFPQPTYTGNVDGIWASATGNARVTEII